MANDLKNPTPPAPAASTEAADLKALVQALIAGQANMTAAIKDGIATGLAMAEMQRQKAAAGEERAREELKNLGPPCPKCLQREKVCGGPEYVRVDGTRTTKAHEKDKDGNDVHNQMVQGEDKNHVYMLVLPKSKRAAKSFQGYILNSVPYLSLTRTSQVLVPRVNDIAWQLQAVDLNAEAELESRSAEWDSGEVGNRARVGQRKALEHGGVSFTRAN